ARGPPRQWRRGSGCASVRRWPRIVPTNTLHHVSNMSSLLGWFDPPSRGTRPANPMARARSLATNPSPSDGEVFPLRNTRTASARRTARAPAEARGREGVASRHPPAAAAVGGAGAVSARAAVATLGRVARDTDPVPHQGPPVKGRTALVRFSSGFLAPS